MNQHLRSGDIGSHLKLARAKSRVAHLEVEQ